MRKEHSMLRRLTIVTVLLINSISYQAVQDISALAYGNLGSVTYDMNNRAEICGTPIAGGVGGIMRMSENIEMEISSLYFMPLENEILYTETMELQKHACSIYTLLRLRLRNYIEQVFSFDIKDENFYGAIGSFTLIPSISRYEISDQFTKKRINTNFGLGTALFIGAGYKYNVSSWGFIDIQIGRVQSLNLSIDSTWIAKAGFGIQVL